tara:strand:- start:54 stop:326 length:273 start_codon:yes stop_codon:yes gene_type:complete
MAITKEEEWDKIEVVGPYKALQLRKKITFKEDGTVINKSNWRISLDCGSLDNDGAWVATDLSSYTQEIQDIGAVVWTDSVIAAWKTKLGL